MNNLYIITDERLAAPIGIVNNKEDIEHFISCYNEYDIGYYYYQTYTKNLDYICSWIPERITPIYIYEKKFYYKNDIMPNGERVK